MSFPGSQISGASFDASSGSTVRGNFEARLARVSNTAASLSAVGGSRTRASSVEVADVVYDPLSFVNYTTADNLVDGGGSPTAPAAAGNMLYMYAQGATQTLVGSLSAPIRVGTPQGGTYYLNSFGGGLGFRFVGIIGLDAAAHILDTDTNRNVYSYYNRVQRRLFLAPGYVDDNANTTYNLASANFTSYNGGTGSVGTYVLFEEDSVRITMVTHVNASAGVGAFQCGIGFDSTAAPIVGTFLPAAQSNRLLTVEYETPNNASGAFHTITMLGQSTNAATIQADFARGTGVADIFATYLHASLPG